MIDRENIIKFLSDFSKLKEYVLAMWLEGIHGTRAVAEYADIDFGLMWISFIYIFICLILGKNGNIK